MKMPSGSAFETTSSLMPTRCKPFANDRSYLINPLFSRLLKKSSSTGTLACAGYAKAVFSALADDVATARFPLWGFFSSLLGGRGFSPDIQRAQGLGFSP